MIFMLGLKRGTVKLYNSHTEWKRAFDGERRKLLSIVSDHCLSIEHIGSTSIDKLSAKPIIDMMMGVKNLAVIEKFQEALIENDYTNRGSQDSPDQILFVKGPEEKRTHYLHITKQNSKYWKEKVLFRDYLIKNELARIDYQNLKIDLMKKYANDRPTYTRLKTEFIRRILRKAKQKTSQES